MCVCPIAKAPTFKLPLWSSQQLAPWNGGNEYSVHFQTGAKIIIRGKGSVKEGKIGRKDGQPLPGEDEPLHAYVTANNPENVKKAVEKVRSVYSSDLPAPTICS